MAECTLEKPDCILKILQIQDSETLNCLQSYLAAANILSGMFYRKKKRSIKFEIIWICFLNEASNVCLSGLGLFSPRHLWYGRNKLSIHWIECDNIFARHAFLTSCWCMTPSHSSATPPLSCPRLSRLLLDLVRGAVNHLCTASVVFLHLSVSEAVSSPGLAVFTGRRLSSAWMTTITCPSWKRPTMLHS